MLYTKEERRELLEEFHSSELSQAEFAREWNINPKTLGKWIRAERSSQQSAFLEVKMPERTVSPETVRVCLPNGIEVWLPVASYEQLGVVLREAARCLA